MAVIHCDISRTLMIKGQFLDFSGPEQNCDIEDQEIIDTLLERDGYSVIENNAVEAVEEVKEITSPRRKSVVPVVEFVTVSNSVGGPDDSQDEVD